MPSILWLSPDDPPDSFPDPEQALDDPEGLLAVGGDLSTPRLLAAYRRGIFPWFEAGQPILWWCPDPRAVLFPNELHVSRRLRRTMRRHNFEVSVDMVFGDVIDRCAASRVDAGTWITREMNAAYRDLHAIGAAHSVEIWHGGNLAGGLYGVNIGRVFFGESMFSDVSDGSKLALVYLRYMCRSFGISLIDCQLPSAHLATLGSRLIERQHFLKLLRRYTVLDAPSSWQQQRCQLNAAIAD